MKSDPLTSIRSFDTRPHRNRVVSFLSFHQRWVANILDPLNILVIRLSHPCLKQMLCHFLITKKSFVHVVPEVMVISIKLDGSL